MLEQAGPLGFVILAVAGLGLLVALAMTGLGITKRRVPASVWILIPIAVAAIGSVGTIMGVSSAIGDVVAAPASERMAEGLTGLSFALGADYLGRIASAALLTVACWGAGLGALIATGPEKRWTAGTAILGILAAVGGAGAIAAVAIVKGVEGSDAFILAALLGFGGLGVGVGSFRRALDDDNAHRVAGMRFASGVSLIFAMFYAAKAVKIAGQQALYEAAATGSLDAITAATANYDALKLIAAIGIGVGIVVALSGFLSEMGDVVQKGTLFDVLVLFVLMGILFGVRSVESGKLDNLRDVALLSPIHEVVVKREIGWLGAADLPAASVSFDRKDYLAKPADVFFGDMIVMRKDGWVLTHRWTGAGWEEMGPTNPQGESQGQPLDEVKLNTELPILLVGSVSDSWASVMEVREAYPDADLNLLLRTAVFRSCLTDSETGEIAEDGCTMPRGAVVEMKENFIKVDGKDFEIPLEEAIPLHVAMVPIELIDTPADFSAGPWMTAHNQQFYIGPVKYWGEMAGERSNLSAKAQTALDSFGATKVHAVLTERARLKDYPETYLNVMYKVADDPQQSTDIALSGKTITFSVEEEAAVLARAGEGFVQEEPENLKLVKVQVHEGARTPEEIERLLSWELPALATCADEFKEEDARGRFEAKLHISAKGNDSDWEDTKRNQVESDDVWNCVMARFGDMAFSTIEDEKGSDIEFHLNWK